MNLRECGYELEIEGDAIKPFEEKILFSGLCDFIVPMSFSNIDNKKKITYDCSGYASLRDMKLIGAREVFEVLEKTLLTLNKSVDFFVPHDKVTINKDTIYYNLKKKNIRIAYIPSKKGSLTEHIGNFIDELSESADDATTEYLMSVKHDLHLYNRNLKDLAGFVSEQRKRIYQCGIK